MPELVMMQCSKLNLRLSTAGCARRFQKAQAEPPKPGDTLSPCQFCPIGAGHAGVKLDPMAQVRAGLGKICPRCDRLTTRLINGKHCVSCYNRHREVLIGKNRRGTVPRKLKLHTARLFVAEGGEVATRVVPKVASPTEAMIALAKVAKGPIRFGLAPAVF